MRERLGFLLIPCLITPPHSPQVKDPAGPTLICLLGPLQRTLITGRRRMEQRETEKERETGQEGKERGNKGRKEGGKEGGPSQSGNISCLSLSCLACGVRPALWLVIPCWLSSGLGGTSHVGLHSKSAAFEAHTHIRSKSFRFFFHCHINSRLILSAAIKPSRQM